MKALLNQKVITPDRIALATDVWLPDGPGPFPTLLTRTPYHKRGALGSARFYTEHRYAYVVQDTRGKYDSGGVFRPLLDEANDGRATLEWIANQPWCNGRIGMVGYSYLGIVQVPAASSGHEALRCIVPGVAPVSYFIDWLRYDGCFALANAVRWGMTHSCFRTTPAEHFQWEELWSCKTLEELFKRAGYECPALREWVEHDTYDDYWREIDQHRMYPDVRVPALHIAGWFDHISRGQFQSYCGLKEKGATELARKNQRILVGPWGHSTIGQSEYGEWNFGEQARLETRKYELRFLDLWLKDIDDGITEEFPVKFFVMGANRWVDFSSFPVPGEKTQAWFLHSSGDARGIGGDGRLSRETPGAESPDHYRYDPTDPVPTLGGPIYWGLSPVGPVDQRPILSRGDLLYYRSKRLEEPLAVIGEVNLELWVRTDVSDTDFIAKLCVVQPDGKVIVLTLGSLRCRYRGGWERYIEMPQGKPVKLRIQMGYLAYVFPKHSRIALIITSSEYPRILPHPNTLSPTWQESSPICATQEILHDANYPSHLLLPLIEDFEL